MFDLVRVEKQTHQIEFNIHSPMNRFAAFFSTSIYFHNIFLSFLFDDITLMLDILVHTAYTEILHTQLLTTAGKKLNQIGMGLNGNEEEKRT